MEASNLGMSVALVNYVKPTEYGTKWGVGGTCLHVGCIPKYMFHHAADEIRKIKLRKALGVADIEKNPEDYGWEKLCKSTQNYIQSEAFSMKNSARDRDIKIYNYYAKFMNDRKIGLYKKWNSLKPSKVLIGDDILIATGERPLKSIEGYEGLDSTITTDDLFKIYERPKTALVLGGGYIALEVISILSGFGVKSKIYHRSEFLRSNFFLNFLDIDRDLIEELCQRLKSEGVVINTELTGVIIKKEGQTGKQNLKNLYETPFIVSATFEDHTKNTNNEGKFTFKKNFDRV